MPQKFTFVISAFVFILACTRSNLWYIYMHVHFIICPYCTFHLCKCPCARVPVSVFPAWSCLCVYVCEKKGPYSTRTKQLQPFPLSSTYKKKHTHTHIYTYICIFVCVYVYIHIYIYICICIPIIFWWKCMFSLKFF